jgi:hypothetical protein
MTSMRKLRRRLLRWKRYDARARKLVPELVDRGMRPGYYRAARAVAEEQNRRLFADYVPRTHDGCCTLHGPGHDGPCVWFCSWCSGDGRCPGCDGWDDMGCDECGGSLACQYCGGKGEAVEW